ncbi:MAG: radical SAM protein [Candidatus Omnitrophota bacterium]
MQIKDLKIALVSLQQDAERVPPVGLVYLATYLKEKAGLNSKNIRIIDKNYFDIYNEIDTFNPHIIGISAMTVNYQEATDFAFKIKRKVNTTIIIGGVHISTLPESFRQCFDIGVIGEGEETLADLARLYAEKGKFDYEGLEEIKSIIYYKNNEIKQSPIRDSLELDSLPLADFSFAHPNYFRKEEIPGISSVGKKYYLISSRGCPYRCLFCSTARFWGKMRLHSPEYTARIAEKALKEYDADFLKVLDDLFTVSPQRLRLIKTEFEKKGILDKIAGIECFVRANLVTEELCKAMKDIKVKVVNFGFESGSEKILGYLKAGSVTVQMNKDAVLLCKKYGFNVYGSLMYGSPTETIHDMKKTNEFIDFCIENNASYIWSFVSTPFPDTPFWDIALQRGKVSNDMDFGLLSHHNAERPLLLDEGISTEEFQKVFLDGRRKLRSMKLKLIKNLILKNFPKTLSLAVKEPGYYAKRAYRQIFKQ